MKVSDGKLNRVLQELNEYRGRTGESIGACVVLNEHTHTSYAVLRKVFSPTDFFISCLICQTESFQIIHPFSIAASSIQGRGVAGAYLQRSTGERWGTSWTGC
ncbi:hypothetical protein ATANTOWER_009633 [Ataeniobius toweri]|uniref:Uncharacterized protein n=1 Tax=Ataeniobius toweri TaxID=208326 RepID=A0ABU7BUD9_9TELE|nr:hypothetical protein [Ataeniobius toweri]